MTSLRDLKPFLPEDLWLAMKKYAKEYNLIPVRHAKKARAYWTRRGAVCAFCGGPFEQVAHKIPHTKGVMEYGFNGSFLLMLWNIRPTCKRHNTSAQWNDDQILRFKHGLQAKLGNIRV